MPDEERLIPAHKIDIDFASAKDLINFFLTEQRFQPQHIFDANRPGMNGYVFRGQACSRPLLASAFRPGDPLKDFTASTPGTGICDDAAKRKLFLGLQLKAELRATFLFIEAADKEGITTPLEYTNLHEHQELIENALNNRDADYESPFPAPHLLNYLALAQHHRIPTRLIDWSESPFVASFFAAYPPDGYGDKVSSTSDFISVFFLATDKIKDENSGISLASAPRRNNSFLQIQKGLFTHIPKANAFFLSEGRWPSLEDMTTNCSELTNALGRVRLPVNQRKELLQLLYALGITESSLMPSLDKAAKAFQYRNAIFA